MHYDLTIDCLILDDDDKLPDLLKQESIKHQTTSYDDRVRKQLFAIASDELRALEVKNARLHKCMQYLIDNGYTAGTGGQTPDELCDDLLPYASA